MDVIYADMNAIAIQHAWNSLNMSQLSQGLRLPCWLWNFWAAE